ncbi:MAG: trehalose-phosphatase [Methanobacterium sp. ERen5]|nr:MAG: trehalose-phosphatase [Methanobacterium sp. ERen5]
MKPKKLFNNLEKFERFKNPQTVIITDIDGTISKIATRPNEATVSNSMKNVLIQIQKKFHHLIIITGRSLEDAFKMIDIPGAVYIGNHGMEYMDDGLIILDEATVIYIPIFRELNEKLKNDKNINIEGITLETKETSTSIHYRRAQNPETTRKTILKTLNNMEETEKLKIKEGKKIIEIRPPIGNDKGKIINQIIKRYGTKKLIYLGDDVTDMDAFKQISQLVENKTINGKSIVVCSNETPLTVSNSADYYVENVDSVETFLNGLYRTNP